MHAQAMAGGVDRLRDDDQQKYQNSALRSDLDAAPRFDCSRPRRIYAPCEEFTECAPGNEILDSNDEFFDTHGILRGVTTTNDTPSISPISSEEDFRDLPYVRRIDM